MYSNDNNFTKDPFENNGRYKIHPLSPEGMEAYLSKNSYNYNYIKTKKNPELLKEIEEEIKKEKLLKEKMENPKLENTNDNQNKKEDLKEETKCTNNNKHLEIGCNKSKNKKGNVKKANINKNNNNSKGIVNKECNKKNEKMKRKQSPGAKLANTIGKLGKVSGPVISNVNNDRGKLWEYPAPYHS